MLFTDRANGVCSTAVSFASGLFTPRVYVWWEAENVLHERVGSG
jgi:hypothetical protein